MIWRRPLPRCSKAGRAMPYGKVGWCDDGSQRKGVSQKESGNVTLGTMGLARNQYFVTWLFGRPFDFRTLASTYHFMWRDMAEISGHGIQWDSCWPCRTRVRPCGAERVHTWWPCLWEHPLAILHFAFMVSMLSFALRRLLISFRKGSPKCWIMFRLNTSDGSFLEDASYIHHNYNPPL